MSNKGDKPRVVIVNPEEKPKSVDLKFGDGYVDFKTPYSDAWNAELGRSHEDLHPDKETVLDIFIQNAHKHPDKQCFGRRIKDPKTGVYGDYQWISWGEALNRIQDIGAGLATLKFEDGSAVVPPRSNIGLFSSNCPEWPLCEYGSYSQSLAVVPLYPTCGQGTIRYIVAHAELRVVFCATSLLATLLDDLSDCSRGDAQNVGSVQLKTVILMGQDVDMSDPEEINKKLDAVKAKLGPKARETFDSFNIKLMTLRQLEALGHNATPAPKPVMPKPSDTLSIVYTSGSEGVPKGVVLKHSTLVCSMRIFLTSPAWQDNIENWMYYSYLPLAHVFERQLSTLLIVCGASIAYTSGMANLIQDLGLARPHMIVGVPRVWKKIHDSVCGVFDAMGGVKRMLFNMAVSHKMESLKTGVPTWVNWDSVILHNLAEKLGGRMRLVINGGAAADPELSLWFSAVFSVRFLQGYGLSETFGAVSMQLPFCCSDLGTIGPLADKVEGRLADVPDMGYKSTDPVPRGELCLRGGNIMTGYYKDPVQTAKALSSDGFFATGDIAQLNPDGSLTIIDRKKNLFKLAQGEYVALEYIETVYGRCPDVAQIWVWGDPLSNFLVAVAVPQKDVFLPRARAQLIQALPGGAAVVDNMSENDIMTHPLSAELLLKSLDAEASSANMLSFQRAKAMLVEPEAWTVEGSLLTPTFKLRRGNLLNKYHDALMQLCHAYTEKVNALAAAGKGTTSSNAISPKAQIAFDAPAPSKPSENKSASTLNQRADDSLSALADNALVPPYVAHRIASMLHLL